MSSNIDDSLWDSSSNDEQSNELEEEEEGEEEEETRSQVTFDTNMTGADFLTPGGGKRLVGRGEWRKAADGHGGLGLWLGNAFCLEGCNIVHGLI